MPALAQTQPRPRVSVQPESWSSNNPSLAERPCSADNPTDPVPHRYESSRRTQLPNDSSERSVKGIGLERYRSYSTPIPLSGPLVGSSRAGPPARASGERSVTSGTCSGVVARSLARRRLDEARRRFSATAGPETPVAGLRAAIVTTNNAFVSVSRPGRMPASCDARERSTHC